jgi:hypothetical protein
MKKLKNKENVSDNAEKELRISDVSGCCSSEMIPPDWDMVEQIGSLWRAYACYICKKCGKPCEPVDAPQ